MRQIDLQTNHGSFRCYLVEEGATSDGAVLIDLGYLDTLEGSIACCPGDYEGERYPTSVDELTLLGIGGESITLDKVGTVTESTISFKMEVFGYMRTFTGCSISPPQVGYTFIYFDGTYIGFGTVSISINATSIDTQYSQVTSNSLGYSISVYEESAPHLVSFTLEEYSTEAGTLGSVLKPVIDNATPAASDEDPYKEGGSTTIGGGGGTFSITGDNVDFPSLPTLSATDTGFITLFNPTTAQLNALSNYMWSGAFDLSTYKKIFADPMDCILGLSIVPVAVPDGGTGEVTVGNISTGVSMTKAGQQYVEVDCGSITINEFWGAYLDYAPYTKIELYLPYCGTHPLDTDDVMKKTIHVKYHIDILSGACCAYVKCGNAVLYSFVGQCSSSIPVTGNDWTNVINGTLSIAASVGTLVATGGMSAPITGAAAMNAGASAATNVMNMKPHVEKSGAMGGTGGMMGLQQPYLILTLPKQARPQNQNRYTGYPSYITARLSTLSGYTEVYSIRLVGITATQQEKTEIVSLLKGGVII